MTFTTNIAILGAGKIATKMATTVKMMEKDERWSGRVKLYAVATRDSLERAQAFADEYGVEVAYGSYSEMLADADVDVVYIATPHRFHAEQAITCMDAGKHVLIEKPFTVNTREAHEVIAKSQETGLTCAEAIWTRYVPSRGIIQNILDSGVIGDITSMSANLSYPMMTKERMTNPELAGGALLDVGIYPLNFISMFMPAQVEKLVTSARLSDQGMDEVSQTTLWFDNKVMADMTSSYWEVGDRCGFIRGTKGIIRVENVNNPSDIVVMNKAYEVLDHPEIPEQLTGFEYEVDAVIEAIGRAEIEPEAMPHAESLRMVNIMDQIRGEWGMTYPFEK